MTRPHSEHELATPAMVIDLTTVERNLERMAEYCRTHGLSLRPHTKTHKSLEMARRQLERGAAGLTVAKAGEAEVMAQASGDILVAYPALDPARSGRLAALAGGITVRVAIDSSLAADALADAARRRGMTIGVLVDLDVGFHRTGVQTPWAAAQLAQHVAKQPHLRLDGLFCYPGHVQSPANEQGPELEKIARLLDEAADLFARDGLPMTIVSGGSTPGATTSHLIPRVTEIRPGTYIYNDWNTVSAGHCREADCAARFLCTVVSDAVPGKVVIDAGSKTLTSDRLLTDPQNGGFGQVVGCDGARVTRLSEEHGEIDITRCSRPPKLGERLWVIPNHVCPCVNLQDAAWLRMPDGSLRTLRTDARGMLN